MPRNEIMAASDVEGFPTVDELTDFCRQLADGHRERVELDEIGRSRQGEPLHLLSITSGGANGEVLVIAQPHPNEPIGMLTTMRLCELLLADEARLQAAGVNWHFVPCADPDGTRLNEGWFKGPFTREHYARHFFRPGSEAQVEWTFPLKLEGFEIDRPLPETEALMVAIDRSRPTVVSSLHNSELGGAYFYATPGADRLYPQLTGLCEQEGIPLHMGEPEFPLSEVLSPAVYGVPTGAELYRLAASAGIDPAALVTGGNSLDYARTQGFDPVAVVMELPYWRDRQASDTTTHPSRISRREAVLRELDAEHQSIQAIRRLYDRAAPLPASPLSAAVESFLNLQASGYGEERRLEAEQSPDFARIATVAEMFSTRDQHFSFRLRLLGMLLRALPDHSAVQVEADGLLQHWTVESAEESQAEVIPIESLVAVQVGSILRAVEFAHPHS